MSDKIIANRLHYDFTHQLLPLFACNDLQGIYDQLSNGHGKAYLNSLWATLSHTSGKYPIWTEINLSSLLIKPRWEAFFVDIPKPSMPPETFFIALVFNIQQKRVDPQVVSMRYFLFGVEKFIEQKYFFIFSEWRSFHNQISRGQLCASSRSTFIDAIQQELS